MDVEKCHDILALTGITWQRITIKGEFAESGIHHALFPQWIDKDEKSAGPTFSSASEPFPYSTRKRAAFRSRAASLKRSSAPRVRPTPPLARHISLRRPGARARPRRIPCSGAASCAQPKMPRSDKTALARIVFIRSLPLKLIPTPEGPREPRGLHRCTVPKPAPRRASAA